MAFIDYGAIVLKNGRLLTSEMFGEMNSMVGWEDTENDVYTEWHHNGENLVPLKLKDNYFAYIGDKDCTIAFYKEMIAIAERYNDGSFHLTQEFFNCSRYKWRKWEMYAGAYDHGFPKIIVTRRNGYYICKWTYKGDKYKVYFGYGVDIGLYKKWRVVNYFRTPAHRFKSLVIQPVKDKIWEYQINH